MVGWAWNHGRGRTSKLSGRRDERAGGQHPHPGKGEKSQYQSPLTPGTLTVMPPTSEPLVSLRSFLRSSWALLSSFVLKARPPSSQLQGRPLLTLSWGLVPFNSSEGPKLASQPPTFRSLLPQLLVVVVLVVVEEHSFFLLLSPSFSTDWLRGFWTSPFAS